MADTSLPVQGFQHVHECAILARWAISKPENPCPLHFGFAHILQLEYCNSLKVKLLFILAQSDIQPFTSHSPNSIKEMAAEDRRAFASTPPGAPLRTSHSTVSGFSTLLDSRFFALLSLISFVAIATTATATPQSQTPSSLYLLESSTSNPPPALNDISTP